MTIDDVDVYVPHQANVRIIEHATRKLGIPEERVVINVDRYGNTSSGSIPLALAEARGRRAAQAGRARAHDRHGRRAHVGFDLDRLDRRRWLPRMTKIAFCFPGQGSVEAGMGREIAEAVPEAMEVYERGSEASGLDLGTSASRAPSRSSSTPRCSSRRSSRPASRCSRRCARAGSSRTSSSATRSASSPRWPRPARCRVDEAIALVRERGLAMAEAAREASRLDGGDPRARRRGRRGGSAGRSRRVAGELQLPGPDRRLRRERRRRRACVERRRRKARASAVKLKVSGAFHSPLVARAAERLRPALERVRFKEPIAPFMSTVTAQVEPAQRIGAAARRPAHGAGALHAGGDAS